VGSKNASFLQQSAYRPFKVDNFGTNRQSVCDVLLVLHCDYGAISCIVSEMRRLLAKIAYFSYSSLIRRSRSTCFLSNFALKLTMTWYRTVTDGQTDGRSQSIVANTALCIASYADAL